MYPSPEILYAFILLFCLYLSWYYFKLRRAFKEIPLVTFGPKFFLRICFAKRPRNISFSTYVIGTLLSIAKKFGQEGIFVLWLFQPLLCITDGGYAKILLKKESDLERAIFKEILAQIIGDGLLTHNRFIWKGRRKMLDPAFRLQVLKDVVPVFNNVGRDLAKQLLDVRDQPFADALPFIRNASLKSLFGAVFGIDTTKKNYDKEFKEIGPIIVRVQDYFMYRFFHPCHYFNSLQFLFQPKQNKEDCKYIENFGKDITKEIINSISTTTEISGQCMKKTLPHILRENHVKEPFLTFKEIQGEILSIFGAGYETSVYTLLWVLLMLALHKEIQEKAFEEIQSIAQGNDAEFSYDDLNDLKYLESVIKETLRLYPTAPIIPKKTTKDLECGKYRIPKNTCIFIFPYVMHRIPDVFPEPEKFYPDRFYEEKIKQPSAYMPFGDGPRICIGRNYAMIQLKIFLAHILLNFQVTSPDNREDIKLDYGMTLRPSKSIRFKFTDRKVS